MTTFKPKFVQKMKKIKKILIANRGEIAVRIIKTCQQLSIATVSVYSEADKNALFVQMADEAVYLGEAAAAASYLNMEKIIQAAQNTQADAIHPGFGFLSENAHFAQLCAENNLIFIGPSVKAIEAMGSKSAAKMLMQTHQVPTIPGYNGEEQNTEFLIQEALKIGFPLLIKASAGGGGKGMRVVRKEEELKSAIEGAKREALNSFGNDKVLLEKYFDAVRHIEFQIFGDQHGEVVHLFERECSIQRRHQKIIEESPSPFMTPELRKAMGEAAVKAGKAIQYSNAGTVEFIVDENRNFYFLEVNTRLQVEHPVTEAITGLDLVALQIRVAEGKPLPFQQSDLQIKGHAIECRLYAEDPENNFLPATGKLLAWEIAKSPQLRIDTGVQGGDEVSIFYDPMLAKLIVHAPTREEAISEMAFVLERSKILGIKTNQFYLRAILADDDFAKGNFNTHFIDHKPLLINVLAPDTSSIHQALLAAMLHDWQQRNQKRSALAGVPSGWRNNFFAHQTIQYQVGKETHSLHYRYLNNMSFECYFDGEKEKSQTVVLLSCIDGVVSYQLEQTRYKITVYQNKQGVFWVKTPQSNLEIKPLPKLPEPEIVRIKGSYNAPMTGEIVKILVEVGQQVTSGTPLVIINSMKMENTIYAFSEGEVEAIFVKEKMFVEPETLLIKINENS